MSEEKIKQLSEEQKRAYYRKFSTVCEKREIIILSFEDFIYNWGDLEVKHLEHFINNVSPQKVREADLSLEELAVLSYLTYCDASSNLNEAIKRLQEKELIYKRIKEVREKLEKAVKA